MKIPYPYWLAAEFILFGPPPRKMTLVHLMIPIFAMLLSMSLFHSLQQFLSKPFLLCICAAGFLVSFYMLCHLCRFVMPMIGWGVEKGFIQSPDLARLEDQVYSSAGWSKASSEKKPDDGA
jgi:hypothetical protein